MSGALDGHWTVERRTGFLPPFGVAKRIGGGRGTTKLLGVPVAWFTVRGTTLTYRLLPVRDELARLDDGAWLGSGYVLGRRFCTFRLRRAETRTRRRDASGAR